MARDKFHEEVKNALEQEGWVITADPLSFKVGKIQVQIDLGAERLIAAEKGNDKIAVEIKTFGNVSFITSLYEAIGKYVVYRNVLKIKEPERRLYLAVPKEIYEDFFVEPVLKAIMEIEQIHLIIYDPKANTIASWIN